MLAFPPAPLQAPAAAPLPPPSLSRLTSVPCFVFTEKLAYGKDCCWGGLGAGVGGARAHAPAWERSKDVPPRVSVCLKGKRGPEWSQLGRGGVVVQDGHGSVCADDRWAGGGREGPPQVCVLLRGGLSLPLGVPGGYSSRPCRDVGHRLTRPSVFSLCPSCPAPATLLPRPVRSIGPLLLELTVSLPLVPSEARGLSPALVTAGPTPPPPHSLRKPAQHFLLPPWPAWGALLSDQRGRPPPPRSHREGFGPS